MEFVEIISRGGFGKVEKMVMPDGTFVARKVFDPLPDVISGADIDKLKQRFKREVRVQQSLPSNFVVPVLDYDLNSDQPWFTMPLCNRNYAVQILEDKKRGEVSKEALADILNSLEELHKLGYVHRDLKPQNILLHNERWKLSDFGLVLPAVNETTQLTSTDSSWGTQMYCAPEQAQNFRNVTSKVDIYAFGCILHDIYSDSIRLPFNRHTCDGQIGTVIEKCTEVNPQRRIKNISTLRNTFFSILERRINISYSNETKEWVNQLEDLSNWDSTRLHNFVRFILSHEDSHDDIWAVFYPLDEDKELFKIDKEYWETISIYFCDWAKKYGFNFSFCDVLAGRLETIFEIGSLECKAISVLALAELGRSHNRYYVMSVLLRLCGSLLDDSVAKRIAIEIQVEEAQNNFIQCATIIDQSINNYHPLIADVLNESRS